MRLSLKIKILLTITSLSAIGLGVYGHFTYQTYKKDKLAFIYNYLAGETVSHAELFSTVAQENELLLSTIISVIDLKEISSFDSVNKFLNGDQERILGLYYDIPAEEGLREKTVFAQDPLWKTDWTALRKAPTGLSLLDGAGEEFVVKKPIGTEGAFAAIVFKQPVLWNVLTASEGKSTFLLYPQSDQKTASLPPEEVALIRKRIGGIPGTSGLFEIQLSQKGQFVSYARLNASMTLVEITPVSKMLMAQQQLYLQTAGFLGLMISISLLIATLLSHWLTRHLQELTEAAEEMERENFDVQVDIKTKDELGALGSAFNSMSTRIKTLLDELKLKNFELEIKVKERTKELFELTNIQKGMLNALGQGFVIVDKDYQILPVYSKVTGSMFEVIPDEVTPGTIMGLDAEANRNTEELMKLVFEGSFDFDDFAKLSPEVRSNSKQQVLALNYAPIIDEASEALKYALIIATDKTEEIANEEKFKKEWNFSQMMMKISSNKFSLNKILGEAFAMLGTSIRMMEQPSAAAVQEVLRLVHTIKGGIACFHITDTHQLCHELEGFLAKIDPLTPCTPDETMGILEQLKSIQDSLGEFVEKFDQIIQYKSSSNSRTIRLDDIQKFQMLLMKDPILENAYIATFFKTRIESFFQIYGSIIQDLSGKLGKKAEFTLRGGELEIPEGPWTEVFSHFIHFIRNSIDHGLETPEERLASGKSESGVIRFSFSLQNGSAGPALKAVLEDDGKGINWQAIAAKDPSVQSLDDAIAKISHGGVSSKDAATDLSGRGVGVSSIFSAVKAAHGSIRMTSRPGKETKLEILIPLYHLPKQHVA